MPAEKFKPIIVSVEDDQPTQTLYREIFQDMGIAPEQVVYLSNASQAKAYFGSQEEPPTPSLIMLSVHIGNSGSGLSLLETLKKEDSPYKNTPVTIITGDTRDEVTTACRRLGADHIIEKPFNIEQIEQVLTEVTGNKE